ncbi:hypothetical protein Syun_017357 [Stephania yunnanensis]|uniref:Uncharacterized protein n=1 Tax=Stephania yunnanensis TaxID=152371 RepID=A0AAP0P4Z8_9MAGN
MLSFYLDPVIGGSLLLTYTTAYIAPLLLVASFAGALQIKVEAHHWIGRCVVI